ncbi:MAG: hypothetical protein ACRELY_04760 [Polyangiaceae bacterium]
MRRLARSLGILLALVAFPLSILSVTTPVSNVGFIYVVGTVIVVGGMMTAPSRTEDLRGMTRIGLAILVLASGIRIATAEHGATISMSRGGDDAPLLDRLLPEGDVATTSARAVIFAGILPANDTRNLVPTLRDSYAKMDAEEGSYPSPILRTSLGLQTKTGYDVIEIVSPSPQTHDAVLFLHGYGGNFTLQCWSVARASKIANATTFCPSTRIWGDWWRGDGPEIVNDMIERLEARGFDRILLAGLSNGALGASALAPMFKNRFVGLLLISGAMTGAPPPGVPAIAFEGARDGMMPPSVVKNYAEKTGASYVEIDGTHFLLLEKLDVIAPKMAAFMNARFDR